MGLDFLFHVLLFILFVVVYTGLHSNNHQQTVFFCIFHFIFLNSVHGEIIINHQYVGGRFKDRLQQNCFMSIIVY